MLQAYSGNMQKGVSLLRQALANSQQNCVSSSPAIQWTATPDAVQFLSGKLNITGAYDAFTSKDPWLVEGKAGESTRFKPLPPYVPAAADVGYCTAPTPQVTT